MARAGERKQRIVASIIQDFSLKPRLDNHRGTAILVAASIYDACHYYRLFQNTHFGKYCGVITSYQPNHNSISREPPDSDERYKFDTYTQHILAKDQTTKDYETQIKNRFIHEPANCKLLIVVSKLLTGFDAPILQTMYHRTDNGPKQSSNPGECITSDARNRSETPWPDHGPKQSSNPGECITSDASNREQPQQLQPGQTG